MWEARSTVSGERSETEQEQDLRGLDRLLELQDIDLSIGRLEARRSELEEGEELRESRARLALAEARVGELRLAWDSVANEQRRLENDIDSIQRKIDAERGRLYDGSVANAKELQSIEAEVESLRGRKSRLEDELIDQMERREDMEARLKPLEAEAAEARQRLAETDEGSAREFVEVEKALGERKAERQALEPEFGGDVLDLYEELRRTKKGIGAAALLDAVCQACHQKLSPMYLDRLKREPGIRRCEYCRRILVFA
jgi:predicted  nucleic acid-binding Zn-ribbon protein